MPVVHELEPVLDPSPAKLEAGMALCLSGGGYRSMLFHAGSLWRLNEAGLLSQIKRISSVSGGSIAAGVLGMNWDALAFPEKGPSLRFQELVVAPLRSMASVTVDERAILAGIFSPGSISEHVAYQYDKALFHGQTLQDLPASPRFVINATNMQSGVLMRFSKPYMRDYRVGQILNPTLPLSLVVAASSACPPLLSPCRIDLKKFGLQFEPADGAEDLNRPPFTTNLVLSDGGVYDNLGLETAWKRYKTILVSDGGAHFSPEPEPHADWARHSYRVIDLVDSQVRAMRTRQIMTLFRSRQKDGTRVRDGCYWGIRQNIATHAKDPLLSCPFDRTTELSLLPTRLQKMPIQSQEHLINWGYAICDASLRRYLDKDLAAPSFPYPASGRRFISWK